MKGTRMAGLLSAAATLAAGVAFAQGRAGTATAPAPNEKPSMEGASRAAEELPGAGKTAAMTAASPDRAFAMKAARGGLAEVELGRIASQNGSDDAVRQFGQRMVDDHSKANDELKQIASSEGIALPTAPAGKDGKTASRLQKMNGADFDRAYMKDMVADHEADVAEFEREARSGKDPELKAFAEKTLPTLKGHLKMAQDGAAKVGATSASKTRKSATTPSP